MQPEGALPDAKNCPNENTITVNAKPGENLTNSIFCAQDNNRDRVPGSYLGTKKG